MRAAILLTVTVLSLVAVAVSTAQQAAPHAHEAAGPVDRAVAVLLPTANSTVAGVVYFAREGEHSVHVTGKITGLKPGLHGFHVHEFGDVTNLNDGTSAGGHFNPEKKPHGKQEDKERHVGDLGNVKADDDGTATIDIKDTMLQLSGPHSILGRGVVVHANEDKFTQPVGDAGGRVAVGVIGVSSPPKQ